MCTLFYPYLRYVKQSPRGVHWRVPEPTFCAAGTHHCLLQVLLCRHRVLQRRTSSKYHNNHRF